MSATPITDTGIRGFLKWFQREQPAIYAKVAPIIAAKIPAAFSGYTQGGWKTAGLSKHDAVRKLNDLDNNILDTIYSGRYANRVGLAALSDSDYSAYAAYISTPNNVTTSYTFSPLTAEITPTYTALPTDSSGSVLSVPSVDTSTAANSGPASSVTTGQIASLINAASGAALAVNTAQLQNQIVQAQLQRAASGLAPSNISLNGAGVPTVASSSSTTELLLLGALVIGAVVLATSGSSSGAKK